MRRRVLTLTVAWLILLGTDSGTAMIPHLEITIDGWSPYCSPARATIRPGGAVHWVNPTASPHTITHDQCIGEGTCLFDSGWVPPAGTYLLPRLPAGEYPYHCRLHPIMRGLLIVAENGETPAPPG